MAEKKQNAQPEKNLDQVEKEKLESVKRADAAVKSMNDFTSPEVLYDELISSVKKYHPSTKVRRAVYHSSAVRCDHPCRSRTGQGNNCCRSSS